MPRNAQIALSSCSSAAGSWLLAPSRSIFCASRLHRLVEPDEAFGRRQAAQRVAHLGESALEPGQRRGVNAGATLAVDALGERTHLGFERLDRPARHRLLDHEADLGEVVAQRLDRAVDPAGPQRLDLVG